MINFYCPFGPPPLILSLACDTILIISQEALFCYPHRLHLFHSPQHSWGIRLFIQPAFPNIFYHTMQSYVLQAFEIVATTGVERRHSNRSSPAGLEYTKKETPIGCLFSVSLKAQDVAERPGDVRLRRPQRSVDIRTVRARQGLNIEKRAIHRMTLFSISLRARDGIRTRDPRLGKAILHH